MLANFLADATENPMEEYQPTHVVRVLEFETVRQKSKIKLQALLNLTLFSELERQREECEG